MMNVFLVFPISIRNSEDPRHTGMVGLMAPTPRLSTDGLVAAAMAIVDDEGLDALTVSAVAADLAVAPSAIYTYCDGLRGLHTLVAVAATENLTTALRNAAIGTAGSDALDAMSEAYRSFALSYPGQFTATLRHSTVNHDVLRAADAALLEVFILVYVASGLDTQAARLAARSTRSAVHGFLALELASGTNDDHDDEFRHLVETLRRGLA